MESKINYVEPLFERVEAYSKTSLELIKLKTVDKTADLASTVISRGAAIIVLSTFVVVFNIGVALWLGDLLGKAYSGFFCVALFYGIIGLILFFFLHEPIKRKIQDSIILQMLN